MKSVIPGAGVLSLVEFSAANVSIFTHHIVTDCPLFVYPLSPCRCADLIMITGIYTSLSFSENFAIYQRNFQCMTICIFVDNLGPK